jgi:hypothetical protein
MQSTCAVLSSVTYLARPYFSTLFHKQQDFRNKSLKLKIICWFSLQILSETFVILRRIPRDNVINFHRSSLRYPLLFSGFNKTSLDLNFEKYPNIKFNENIFSGSRIDSCGRTDRQTDMTNLNVAFHNFVKEPKKNRVSTFFVLTFPEYFLMYFYCGRRVAHFIR